MAQRKAPPPRVEVTPAALSQVAIRYLNRRDASRQRLTTHLEDWIRRRGNPPDPAPARPLIRELVERYEASGVMNEQRLATNAVESLRARGQSSRAISYKLKQRGVETTAIDSALAVDRAQNKNAELEAATALVRKKRLGPFRPAAERAEKRQRDLAALARAGFDFETARRALGASSEDDEF
jgi:regulatory protein